VLDAVLKGETLLIIMLPTGRNKSLLFMVPAYLDNIGVIVVVVPFQALINNLVIRI
jgi:superfamily II DNA helicase RecQ